MIQLPLCELAPDPLDWTNGRISVVDEPPIRMVLINGVVFSRYVHGDSFAERHAIITLVQDGWLQPREIRSAFGQSVRNLYRWQKQFDDEGLDGLRDRKKKSSPWKMRGAMEKSIRSLRALGLGYGQIAKRLGVSASGVRYTLKRLGLSGKSPENHIFPFDWSEVSGPVQPDTEPETLPPVPVQAEPERSESTSTLNEPASKEQTVQDVRPCIDLEQTGRAGETREVSAPDGQVITLDIDPLNRQMDRMLASQGGVFDAAPWFTSGHAIPSAGVLLAVPLIVCSGILGTFRETYPELLHKAAFYGLRTTVLALLLMALMRVKRPENLKEYDPVPLGRVLGLDRAPEVKTLRRKLSVLASFKRGTVVMREMAKRQLKAQEALVGFLYIDGHVREYHGKGALLKGYSVRRNLAVKATTDTFVNDARGDPLFLVTKEFNAGLTQVLTEIAQEVKSMIGEGRRFTMVFDRGGWKPELFAQLYEQGVDVLTYRKGKVPAERIERGKPIRWKHVLYPVHLSAVREQIPRRDFFGVESEELEGTRVEYALCERSVRMGKLTVCTEGGTERAFWMREVTRLCEDGEHETVVMTTRQDLRGVEVLYRMFNRWRQENFFKYMRQEYAIDGLVDYDLEALDATLERPNPERRKLEKKVKRVGAEYRELSARYGELLQDNPTCKQPTVADFKLANEALGKKVDEKRGQLDKLKREMAGLPERVSAAGVEKLSSERKLVTDTVKMAAYRVETELVRLMSDAYSRTEDEGRRLIASALRSPGDIEPVGDELRVTLGRQSSAHRDRALGVLCERLNELDVRFPGSALRLRFGVSPVSD